MMLCRDQRDRNSEPITRIIAATKGIDERGPNGARRTPEYLAINPAGQIPTIVDHGAPGGPRVLAQSGAIVLYACNKAGRHIPTDEATHYTAMQWCMQAATDIGGASAGLQQVAVVAPEKVQSTVELFEQRFIRYFGYVDQQLQGYDFLAGDFSFADIISGHVDMVFSGLPSISEYLKSGTVKALAIASPQRSPFAPEVPTMSEAGVPGFESIISQGLFAPAGTPDDIVVKLNTTVNQIMGGKEMAARAQQLKVEPRAYTSAEYKAWLADQAVAWAKLIKDTGIKLE